MSRDKSYEGDRSLAAQLSVLLAAEEFLGRHDKGEKVSEDDFLRDLAHNQRGDDLVRLLMQLPESTKNKLRAFTTPEALEELPPRKVDGHNLQMLSEQKMSALKATLAQAWSEADTAWRATHARFEEKGLVSSDPVRRIGPSTGGGRGLGGGSRDSYPISGG